MTAFPDVPPGVDPSRPSPVRLYNYFLGGTHNFPADREAAEPLKAAVPDILDAMLANRGFHGRAAIWIAGQGIRQFIDIGAGLPTRYNLHEAVHKVSPDARVVYVDHDPMVAAYSGPLLAADGTTTLVTADWRDPCAALSDPGLQRLIDLGEPAGVLMTTFLSFVPDEADPWGLMARYLQAVAPGSYLARSHGTYDRCAEDIEGADTEGSRGIYCGVARRP